MIINFTPIKQSPLKTKIQFTLQILKNYGFIFIKIRPAYL